MLFTPHPTVDQILLQVKQHTYEQGHPVYQFLSLSVEMKRVDPLVIMQEISTTQPSLIYMENRHQQLAILGFDVATSYRCEGHQRFAQARTFIQDCLARMLITGVVQPPLSGPHFFCTFTFSPQSTPQLWLKTAFPHGWVILPRWQIMQSHNHCILVANAEIQSRQPLTPDLISTMTQSIWKQVQYLEGLSCRSVAMGRPCVQSLKSEPVIAWDGFKTRVKQAINAISDHQLKKIVLANAIDIEATQPFQIPDSLQILREHYPGCYVFAVQHSEETTFLGASPEVLLQTRGQQLLTEAIAGSAPRGQTQARDVELANGLLQGSKERYEHEVVVKFIMECLQTLGLDPHLTRSLSLRQLSNIQHLWTPIRAYLPDSIHPLDVLAQLHPTPAVAGLPRDQVLTELVNYEPFDRLLFAAPLGWIDAQGNSEFAVGIRSALIQGTNARLYAGAGIVADSQPDQELAEVQLKLTALLDCLA